MLAFVVIGFLFALARSQEYYILQSSFAGGPTFLDNFNFWTSWDPTFGYVHYVDQATAEQYQMINTTSTTVSFGVETTQILDPNANLGRLSLRLTSIETWTHGLFILDLVHMPAAACGTWPSFWSLGGTGTWPMSGEIDIIEFVNDGADNLMSLHTLPGCTIAGADETGTLLSSDCGLGGGIEGCTVEANSPLDSGADFNADGGGVYAMEWTSTAIRIWSFPRSAIPASITLGVPDVTTFGLPIANFEGTCDIDAYFYNHSLIFNTDFCGQWAGPTFNTDGCPALDPSNSWSSCNEFVALNPGAFTETYWEVNYLNVYQLVSGTAPTLSSSLSSVTPAIATSSVSTALGGAQGRSSTPTMSIAGTTPVITTGSFTATSSVLSVLSSLSASSVFASSVSASLAGRAASSSISSVSSVIPVIPPATSSGTANPFITPAIQSSRSLPCTGTICTSYTTALVVQTVTVDQSPLNDQELAIFEKDETALHQLPRRFHGFDPETCQTESSASTITEMGPKTTSHSLSRNTFGRCDFAIAARDSTTDFWCTFTSFFILNAELWTASFTESTALSTGEHLMLGHTLEIDRFVVKTEITSSFASRKNHAVVGSFTPSGTYAASTTVTARPLVSQCAATATSKTGQ